MTPDSLTAGSPESERKRRRRSAPRQPAAKVNNARGGQLFLSGTTAESTTWITGASLASSMRAASYWFARISNSASWYLRSAGCECNRGSPRAAGAPSHRSSLPRPCPPRSSAPARARQPARVRPSGPAYCRPSRKYACSSSWTSRAAISARSCAMERMRASDWPEGRIRPLVCCVFLREISASASAFFSAANCCSKKSRRCAAEVRARREFWR